ncbi:MAG TPA: cyclophilin-like fold protein [Sumerlaeia bacterium]|nr:cyclophilin-like fold protein [Sumerlaeia bacterium]
MAVHGPRPPKPALDASDGKVSRKIEIDAGGVVLRGRLNDSATARALAAAMPFDAEANLWGDEIYFSVPVSQPEEDPREVVACGDLGYWPPGRAFCIFFGPTPSSRGDEIRPASPVNVVGRVEGDATLFRSVPDGAPVRVRLLDP